MLRNMHNLFFANNLKLIQPTGFTIYSFLNNSMELKYPIHSDIQYIDFWCNGQKVG